MARQILRIVTGHNAQGRSMIISDTWLPASSTPGAPLRVGFWLTDRAPASNRGNEDAAPGGVIDKTAPQHRGGSVFRISEIPPESSRPQNPQELARRGVDVTPERSARHPGFHRTNTVDYAICLEGEIWAVLDENETLMKAGDVLIQRGTYHAWANRSDKPALMAFILLDAEPL
jgi:naringenin degradation protein FdeH